MTPISLIESMAVGVALAVAHPLPVAGQDAAPITTVSSDGVTIHGEPYFGNLDGTAPLVLLFHQGGSSGRGEYARLAPWLNEAGFRAIAWDQRSGGDLYGEANRTVQGLRAGAEPGFCDAQPDLQAALDYVTSHGLAESVVVWGSSYSGALVFRLAAENPGKVSGVLAFSPASGGPVVNCRARSWIASVSAPAVVFRPQSEMDRPSSTEQRDILTGAGAAFHVVEDGVHGSSMLLDSRTGHDMSDARRMVIGWLNDLHQARPIGSGPVHPRGPA